LSLQIGHRESIDIDLFSDADYGSLDFRAIEIYLKDNFQYVDFFRHYSSNGESYSIGENKENTVKLDLYYTDDYIQPYRS
jgi:hypothetical protein